MKLGIKSKAWAAVDSATFHSFELVQAQRLLLYVDATRSGIGFHLASQTPDCNLHV